jgi:hypothetical protein
LEGLDDRFDDPLFNFFSPLSAGIDDPVLSSNSSQPFSPPSGSAETPGSDHQVQFINEDERRKKKRQKMEDTSVEVTNGPSSLLLETDVPTGSKRKRPCLNPVEPRPMLPGIHPNLPTMRASDAFKRLIGSVDLPLMKGASSSGKTETSTNES